MDLDALEIFRAVAQAGSLSAAARLTGMPVSSVSRRLQALERELGALLLQRSTRRLALTDDGRALLEQVQAPLRELQLAAEHFRQRGKEPTGCLRIAAAPTLAQHWLPALLARYLARHAGVTVELTTDPAPVDLHSAGIDVALRVGPPARDPGLVVRRLRRSGQRIVAAPAYLKRRGTPSKASALPEHDLIALMRAPEWPLQEQGVALAPRVKVPSASIAHLLCLSGAGVAVLPEFLVAEDLKSGRLVEVLKSERPSARDVFVAYTPQGRKLPKVRAFVELAQQALAEPG